MTWSGYDDGVHLHQNLWRTIKIVFTHKVDDASLIRKLVRDHDRDRYVASLFLNEKSQARIFPILAFNIELERIPLIVSEPQLGEIRLQWWRDTLGKVESGESIGHPVADSLAFTIANSDISTVRLLEMIDARSFDLSQTVFPDINALKSYFNKTTGAIFSLSEELILESKVSSGRLVERAAHAMGLMQILRLLPHHVATGRIFIPREILNQFQVDTDLLFEGQIDSGLNQLLAELRNQCRLELRIAGSLLKKVNPAVSVAYRSLVVINPYLALMESNTHNPLKHIVELNPLQRLWLLWRGTKTLTRSD